MEKLEFKERIVRKVPFVGGEPVSGTLVETIYRPEMGETAFAVWNGSTVRYEKQLPAGENQALIPYSPQNTLLRNRIVIFPSATADYSSEDELFLDVRAFIHRYVTVTPLFEGIAARYVLLSWIYDSFSTLPYLRVRGDYGSGKSRFLSVVGALCFRPIFTGTTTVSAMFRLLDTFRGTLVIDEGDFRVSDFQAEITKLLNNGNAKGFPVLRSEQVGRGKEYSPAAFDVFGPKIIATRAFYQDPALESRFISEDMGRVRPRQDTPLHLPETFDKEAEALRNKLLMFRFRNLKRYHVDQVVAGELEPRIAQIFAPLLALVDDENERGEILELLKDYSHEVSLDRSINIEARVAGVIQELWIGEPLLIKAITARLNEKYGEEFQEQVSAKRVGAVVRKNLHLRTRKRHGLFEIMPTEGERVRSLLRRFGMDTEQEPGRDGDIGTL